MSKKNVIWCSHPKNEEILPSGKKRYWKTGPKPAHSKGTRVINEDLADFINKRDERIINGSSKKLVEGDYLCSTCFGNEQSDHSSYEEMQANVDDGRNYVNCGLDNELNSPFDDDRIHIEQDHATMKLNQVFQYMNVPMITDIRNTNQISQAVDEVHLKLKKLSNILLSPSRRTEKAETFVSLDLSIDHAVWILQHFRKLFVISIHEEQQRILTMLPPTWSRDRVSDWFDISYHQARYSIALR